jgi:hypothetical protein
MQFGSYAHTFFFLGMYSGFGQFFFFGIVDDKYPSLIEHNKNYYRRR